MKKIKLNKLKRITALFMAVLLVVGMANWEGFSVKVNAAGTDAVTIVDENLRKAICTALGKDYTEGVAITEDEMASLKELIAENAGITDITGLEKAVNLEKLDLSGNAIGDSIRNTKKFADAFNSLASLTKLKDLDLSYCQIGNNTSLSQKLNVPDNAISNSLMMMTSLENVNLSNNSLTGSFGTYTQYGGWVNLKTLDLSHNCLNQLIGIDTKKMSKLEKIDISDNYIFWDERDGSWVTQLMSLPDTIQVDYTNQKNLSVPFGAYYVANGIADGTYTNFSYAAVDYEKKEINLGNVSGDITFGMSGYTSANSTKITISDSKFTMLAIDALNELTTDINHYKFIDLQPGEYSYPVEIMHMGGQKDTYTLKFKVVEVPASESDNSAGINDPAVQYAVCKALKKTDDFGSYVVTKADMETIKTLSISNVKDTSGIEYAKNLTSLSLTGNYTTISDISGMTEIKSLTLNSSNLNTLVDISKMPSMTTLNISQTRDGKLPSVSENTKLQYIRVYYSDKDVLIDGIENCSVLRRYDLVNATGKHTFPTNINTTYNLGLSIAIINPEENSEYDFNGVESIEAKKVGISVSNYYGGKNVKITGIGSNSTNITSFVMTAGEQSMIPDTIGYAPNLTSMSLKGDFAELPESLKNNETITSLTIEGATEYPSAINDMKGLKTLNITQSNNIDYKDIDLSALSNLTSINITYSDLTMVPAADKLPESLTKAVLNNNKITGFAGGDYSKLDKLTSLDLETNNITDFPTEVSQMKAMQSLKLQGNYYGQIGKNVFDELSSLKELTIGHYIPVQETVIDASMYQYEYSVDNKYPDTATAVAKADETIKANGGSGVTYGVNYIKYLPDSYSYAGLTRIDSSEGVLAQGITQDREVFAMLSPEATSVTIKPEAVLPDTTIIYDGKSYKSGDEIVINNLQKGNNDIVLTCKNDFDNMAHLDKEVTYTITLFAGNTISPDALEDGHTYKVNYKLYKSGQTVLSMSSSYFLDYATVRYKNGKYEVNMTTTQSSYISDMDYYDEAGNRLDAELVDKDAIKDTATYRVKLDKLDEYVLSPYVVPMGYYPQCDVRFDLNSIIDITDTLPAVDLSELNIAINKALEITDKNNIYTNASYSALTKALEEAQKVAADTLSSQEEADAAKDALNQAIEALAVDDNKIANKTNLKSALDEANKIEKGNHTDSAWNTLKDVIADAQAVYDDQYATQKEVDSAVKSINNAVTLFNNSGEASTLDKNNLADGVYSVYVDMVKADNKTEKSMADNAINHTVKLEVKNGEYFVTLDFKGITIENRFGYLKNLSYYNDGYTYGQYGKVEGTRTDAIVLSTQKDSDGKDIVDQYNDTNNLYPDLVQIKLVKSAIADENGYAPLHVFVPIMESIAAGNGDHDVLMKVDWSSLKKTTDDDPGFQPEEPVEQSPAVDATDVATGVKVHADKGVFEEGVKLVVNQITTGDVYNKATTALSDVGKKFKLYEVHFVDASGNEVQPNGTVTVSYPIPEGYDSANIVLYRINEDGSKTLVKGVAEDGYFKVITKSFSTYALVEKGSTITDADNTAQIEANKSAESIKTGDSANTILWAAVLMLAVAGMAGTFSVRRRKVKEQ